MLKKMYKQISLLVFLIVKINSEGNCGVLQIQSANGTSCVDQIPLLVGGSNLAGWRKDGEILLGDEFVAIGDFPYLIDAPYGFYAGPEIGVVICGGKNWDDDVVENRCWQYNQCSQQWVHVTDMPFSASGGVGVPIQDQSGNWNLWLIGGGDGEHALPYIWELRPRKLETGDIEWDWVHHQDLFTGRYGHCAVYHQQLKKIVVMAGRNNDEVLSSVEMIDPVTETIEEAAWNLSLSRWGLTCQYVTDSTNEGQIAVMGGMDSYFIPHSDFSLIKIGQVTTNSQSLPWSASGHIGVPVAGFPTFAGGFSLLGFQRRIASFQDGSWKILDTQLSSSRVSGLAISVPQDFLQYC